MGLNRRPVAWRRRFTQPDPIGLAGGLNLYGYANGDPINGSDPFGLEVVFKNDDDGTLRQAWNHAKRALREQARNGDKEAAGALYSMRRMENDKDNTFTFVNESLAHSLGDAMGQTARIDVAGIGRARSVDGLSVNVASVMVHEAGHLFYNATPIHQLNPSSAGSNSYAMSWDNAYRRSVWMPERANHHSYPRR